MTKKNKKAFTLAEVLITLGIIGIIAALTIPALMKNIEDKQLKEAAKEAYSKSAQAVTQMKADEGGSLSYYLNTNNSFSPVFSTYFKKLKNSGIYVVPSSAASDIYSSFFGNPGNTQYLDDGQFITADGMFFGIDNYVGTGILAITVDVNGYTKKPNVYGRDVFMFQVLNNNLVPMGGPNTYFPASSYCKKISGTLQGLGCMYNVMQGIDY